MNIAFTDSNHEALKNVKKFGVELKIALKKYMKINQENMEKITRKLSLIQDDLPSKKQLKFLSIAIIVRSVFEESGTCYPRIFLDECLYQV